MDNWKAIPGHREYEVSDTGKVRSVDREVRCSNGDIRRYKSKRIAASTDKGGYQMVALYRSGKCTHIRVHRLVLMAFFVGPVLPGSEGCHNNGEPHDNRFENLRWDSRAGNFSDKKSHGTENQGERNVHAKLTVGDVVEIRKLYSSGASSSALSEQFSVSRKHVQAIVAGRTWKHVRRATA